MSSQLEIIVTSKPTSLSAEVIRAVVRLSGKDYDFTSPDLPIIYVYLRKGESPITKAKIRTLLEDSQGRQTCELILLDNGIGKSYFSWAKVYLL